MGAFEELNPISGKTSLTLVSLQSYFTAVRTGS